MHIYNKLTTSRYTCHLPSLHIFIIFIPHCRVLYFKMVLLLMVNSHQKALTDSMTLQIINQALNYDKTTQVLSVLVYLV